MEPDWKTCALCHGPLFGPGKTLHRFGPWGATHGSGECPAQKPGEPMPALGPQDFPPFLVLPGRNAA